MLEERRGAGLLPDHLHVGYEPRHDHEVDRTVTDHLVGDLELAATRVAGLRDRRHLGLSSSLLLLALRLSQLDAADLAGERLRQIADELDLARVRERRQVPAHELLDVVLELRRRLAPLA